MSTLSPRKSWRWIVQVASCAAIGIGACWLLAPTIRAFLKSTVILEADRLVAASLHAASTPLLTALMVGVSHVHGTAGILVMTAIAAITVWRYSNRLWLPALIVTVPGGLLLNVAVKHAVQRSRPDWGYALQVLDTYSFPSGHTAGAAFFYGFVVIALWPHVTRRLAKSALLIAAVSMVVLVACSRIVLGVHFMSDCVGAAIEAGAWLTICFIFATTRSATASHGVAET